MERCTNMSANDFYNNLNGSECIHRYFPNYFLTDAVKEVATKEECFWFLDIILSYQIYNQIEQIKVQYWNLERVKDSEFLVTAKDEDGNILITQKIPFSDFYFKNLEFRLSENIIFLPSED